jgi:hypothetical protein
MTEIAFDKGLVSHNALSSIFSSLSPFVQSSVTGTAIGEKGDIARIQVDGLRILSDSFFVLLVFKEGVPFAVKTENMVSNSNLLLTN